LTPTLPLPLPLVFLDNPLINHLVVYPLSLFLFLPISVLRLSFFSSSSSSSYRFSSRIPSSSVLSSLFWVFFFSFPPSTLSFSFLFTTLYDPLIQIRSDLLSFPPWLFRSLACSRRHISRIKSHHQKTRLLCLLSPPELTETPSSSSSSSSLRPSASASPSNKGEP
jgi:hypothetical protein